jgi:hypothetical protein
MRVILGELRKKVENQAKTSEEIQYDLEQVLEKVMKKRKKVTHQMLCGFYEAGTYHLLETLGVEVSPVPVWYCIGTGESSLTKYLGGIFLAGDILPLYRSVPICIYLVAQAKRYLAQWCGGDTDIAVVTKERTVVHHAGTRYDAACNMVEAWLNGILTSATEPNISAEKIQQLIGALRNVLDAQTGSMTGFLFTGDCIGCGKEHASTEAGAKFCGACKRWVCALCVGPHMQKHISDQAAGKPS